MDVYVLTRHSRGVNEIRKWSASKRELTFDGEGLTWGGAELTPPLHKSVRFDMSCFSSVRFAMSCICRCEI